MIVSNSLAQESANVMELSIAEAQEYALINNRSVKSSRLDRDASRMAVWEAISNGLPQVNGSASLNDNLKLMTTLLPGEFFGTPGVKIPVQFGSKYNSGFGVQASLLLFSAPYYVGIQAAKISGKISDDAVMKTEQDIRESVIGTYHLILISKESIGVLEGNIANLEENLRSTKAMFSVGMAESTDVDQLEMSLAMVRNTKSSMERGLELSYNLMRFQLGLDAGTTFMLKDDLNTVIASLNTDELLKEKLVLEDNFGYRMVKSQQELSALNLKGQKAAVLPTLSGFYSYSKSGMGDKLNDLQWFPNSMIGLQLSVPIFASGMRYSRIKKAEFGMKKAMETTAQVSDQILLQEKQLRYNLKSAEEQYQLSLGNIEVAKRVYQSTENKYKQGMVSSLELTLSSNNLLQAQNGYISSLMNLLQTKLSLDKLLNNY